MEAFENRVQGIVREIEQVDGNITIVRLECFQGDNKRGDFIFHGQIDRNWSGEFAEFRDYLIYDSLSGSYKRLQSLEIGNRDQRYISLVPEEKARELKAQAYKENPVIRGLQLVV